MQNLHLTFVLCSASQNQGEDFAKFCGLLRIYELYEVIVSPKMPTKHYQDFCPGSLLEGRAEILVIFGWHFGRNDDLIN